MKLRLDLVNPSPWRVGFPIGPFTWTKRKRLQENRNTMTVFLGPPRSGKTNAASVDGENCSVSRAYKAKDITFLPQDYLHSISQAAAGDQKQFDEPGAEWGSRQFMSIENKMLNATHVTFGSKLINVDWAVPVLRMQDVQARMLINYVFTFRDTGPRGIAKFAKNWVDAYTGKTGRTNLGLCYWAEAWQERPEELKEYLEMKIQYQDSSYARYYREFAKGEDEFKEKADESNDAIKAVIDKISKDSMPYLTSRGLVAPESFRREFHLTHMDAKEVARQVNAILRNRALQK